MKTKYHDCQDLIMLFNTCFKEEYNTQLIGGGDEPIYLPANGDQSYHTIVFTKDYFRSALHECAHWFIAGTTRRECIDYGYWYEPDGRNATQQTAFEKVEVKPQALEWILSNAANHPFSISLDNLNQPTDDSTVFKEAVYQQVINYRQNGLPKRAKKFIAALYQFYGVIKEEIINEIR